MYSELEPFMGIIIGLLIGLNIIQTILLLGLIFKHIE